METWFSRGLQKWYNVHKRDLPWRHESDPYRIWLSEIILQQTQVKQGLSYYLRFIKNYPRVTDLARAAEDKVLKDWQGLGYYSRARNLQVAARSIVHEHGGVFPGSFEALLKLKGIGEYTASAIASFAFGLPYAVVDGNVYRVLSRIFGIETPVDSASGKKQFKELAQNLLDKKDPATHNQAIMEFGSQWCKPVNPLCDSCIFKDKCIAYNKDLIGALPVKSKKTKQIDRFLNYFVLIDKDDNVLIHKRSGTGIWQGLYEFYLLESDRSSGLEELLKNKNLKDLLGEKCIVKYTSAKYKHLLSHQILHAQFYVIRVKKNFEGSVRTHPLKSIQKLAFPRLIENFINDCELSKLA